VREVRRRGAYQHRDSSNSSSSSGDTSNDTGNHSDSDDDSDGGRGPYAPGRPPEGTATRGREQRGDGHDDGDDDGDGDGGGYGGGDHGGGDTAPPPG
jgi:hypothetical protein